MQVDDERPEVLTPATMRAWRDKLRMTQAEVAHALGVSKRAVEGWESDGSGGREPPAYLSLALERLSLERWAETGDAGRAHGTVIYDVSELRARREGSLLTNQD